MSPISLPDQHIDQKKNGFPNRRNIKLSIILSGKSYKEGESYGIGSGDHQVRNASNTMYRSSTQLSQLSKNSSNHHAGFGFVEYLTFRGRDEKTCLRIDLSSESEVFISGKRINWMTVSSFPLHTTTIHNPNSSSPHHITNLHVNVSAKIYHTI